MGEGEARGGEEEFERLHMELALPSSSQTLLFLLMQLPVSPGIDTFD